jgi:transcription factor SPN1
MLARRKEEKSHRRKRKNIINYNDDIIAQLLLDMRNAAEENRKLCLQNQP